jgi:exodeoxyribonuclease III
VLRLVTLNVNGIRSATRKGLEAWAAQANIDCMGVQEVKAQAADISGSLETLAQMPGYFHFAEKKGYSGVGLYTRHEPSDVIQGFDGAEFDTEGRWVELRFDRPGQRLSLISCYFPSGSSSDERQAAKFRFLALMAPHLARLKAEREFILMGDVNIAHHEIDLKNWRGNLKNSGFLPEERAWMTELFEAGGLVDVFRRLNPQAEQYTWWSNRGQAWANNVGWRIDYHLATPALAQTARKASIHLKERFSDHAPLTIDYDFSL